jgi:1-acyl-sn-glycerol-3-phosphate acyltransferase
MVFLWSILCALVLVSLALVGGRAYGAKWMPRLGALDGLLYLLSFAYARGVHDLQVEIEEGALEDLDGPMIVVCNHTAGVDPILVSLSVPTKIRWMMAEDMRLPYMQWFWDWVGVIFVARNRHGRTGLRRARAHLDEGGVIGIFPEGRIERPAGKLMKFAPGVGVLVKRSGARVLPVMIEGTPTHAKNAWESLWMRSETRVRVMKPIDYKDSGMGNADIARDLRERYERWTGWETTGASASAVAHQAADAVDGELLAFDDGVGRRQIA